MKRAAFLKRMAFAAVASAFFDVERLLPEPEESVTIVEWWVSGPVMQYYYHEFVLDNDGWTLWSPQIHADDIAVYAHPA